MNSAEAVQRTDNIDHLYLVPQEKSLLVVEDDLALIEFLDSVLTEVRPDLDWEYVTTGEEALKRLRQRAKVRRGSPFDLVIADIFLEGELTGFDVWMDSQQSYPRMPFIITSSLSFDRYFSILRGINNCPTYLPKPLTATRCRSVVEEYF